MDSSGNSTKVLRLKGLVAAEGGKAFIIQGVHDTYDSYETRTKDCEAAEGAGCTLVVIGRHLDRAAMQSELTRILTSPS